MSHSVKEMDSITNLRMRLKNNIYNNNCFKTHFLEVLQTYIPIFSIQEIKTERFKIVIDSNKCINIENYNHGKEFYIDKILKTIIASITYIKLTDPTIKFDIEKSNIIEEFIHLSSTNPMNLYRLFDFTVILDNVLIIDL